MTTQAQASAPARGDSPHTRAEIEGRLFVCQVAALTSWNMYGISDNPNEHYKAAAELFTADAEQAMKELEAAK